ncbi:DUF4157 domain-containing protein [Candidatus Nitrososphaera evergladensis]|nr:DUF4157 domain-containing protein [Candidatus Nitrososphaera evergladensis]
MYSDAGFDFANITIQPKLKVNHPHDAHEQEAESKIDGARSGGGSPLDTGTREFMESRFGHDFSNVRLHTDEKAARSARSLNALAYTIGNDITFGKGQYQPGTRQGRELLAHELAHTIQQRGADAPPSNDPQGIHETSARTAAQNVVNGQSVRTELPASGVGLSMQPAEDEERKKAIAEAEAGAARIDQLLKEDEEESLPEMPRRPTTLSLIKPDPRFQARMVTDEQIYAPLKEFDEREKAAKTKKRIVEEALDETRPERFQMFRKVLNEHGFAGDVLASFMSERIPMRDLQVLRRYGLEWPHWYNRSKFQGKVEDALDRFFADQHYIQYGRSPVVNEFTKEDQEALEREQMRQRVIQAWLTTISHATGSLGGALGAGITDLFTDDPEKIAAGGGLGTAATGVLGAFAQARINQGTYVPDVENPLRPEPTPQPKPARPKGYGNPEASAKAAIKSETKKAPEPSLTELQQEIVQDLMSQGHKLAPRTATEAAKGAAEAIPTSEVRSSDVRLVNGKLREVTAFEGKLDNLGGRLARKGGQKPDEIFVQVNTPGVKKEDIIRLIQGPNGIRYGYQELAGVYVKVFDSEGAVLWSGTFGSFKK